MPRPRRRLTGAVLTVTATLAAGALAGCSEGSTDGAGTDAAAGDAGREFTDDLGSTVALEQAPTRVAVQAGQVHPWEYLGMDFPAQAAYMEQLAGWLTEGERVT